MDKTVPLTPELLQILSSGGVQPPQGNNFYTGADPAIPVPKNTPPMQNPATYGVGQNTLDAVRTMLQGKQLQDQWQNYLQSVPMS